MIVGRRLLDDAALRHSNVVYPETNYAAVWLILNNSVLVSLEKHYSR